MSYLKFPYDTIIAMGYHKHTYGKLKIEVFDSCYLDEILLIKHTMSETGVLVPLLHDSMFWYYRFITNNERVYVKGLILYIIKEEKINNKLMDILRYQVY
jgi:hypothetical protein